MSDTNDEMIILGKITGIFGIKGWLKLYSNTRPIENICQYKTLWLQAAQNHDWQPYTAEAIKPHAKTIIAKLASIDSPETAQLLLGSLVAIPRTDLPTLEDNEYYWRDLIGCHITNLQNISLGIVDHLLETGANDVLVVKDAHKERLIPFIQGTTIIEIDIGKKHITVDWDEDF